MAMTVPHGVIDQEAALCQVSLLRSPAKILFKSWVHVAGRLPDSVRYRRREIGNGEYLCLTGGNNASQL